MSSNPHSGPIPGQANDGPPCEQPRDDLCPPPKTSDQERPAVTQGANLGEVDRVYPISSLVSFDPSPGQEPELQAHTSPNGTARQYPIIDSETWSQLQSQSDTNTDSLILSGGSQQSLENSGRTSLLFSEVSYNPDGGDTGHGKGGEIHTQSSEGLQQDLVTTRFKHIVTDDGHAVVAGRTVDSFKACEDEPIHIPGAVQTFGVLIGLREEAEERLSVRVVSENSEVILGYSPSSLFALESFCDILPEDQLDIFLDHIDFVLDKGYDPSVDGPEVFTLAIKKPGGGTLRLWCAVHISPDTNGLIVCEFELEDDQINPLRVAGDTSPTAPADTLGMTPTAEQLAGSTVNIHQPLRVLRRARRRKGEAAAMEVFSIVSQIQDQMSRADSTETLLDITVGIVKELTGFHRVLVYQFDSEFNGKVVAELVDPTMSIDLYKGLNFPAADIPKQARDLYRINKVRLLYDRDQITSRLVCRTLKDLETPVDMTHAYLRAMSPIHIKYLANMAVRSSMSISIHGSSDLWGLISLHSYGLKGMRVSFPIRKMCRLIGETVSRNIQRLSYTSRLQARKLINTIPSDANPSGYIVASSDDLIRLFDADYGALCIRGETKILAKSPQLQEMLALIEYLKRRRFTSVLTSKHVVKDFRDLQYSPGFKDISGLLYVPLSADGIDFIVFFRRGHLTEVKWGGNPYEKKFTDGHLEPRKSFQTWSETVLDQSREWTESEVDTAAVLCLVYGKFIQVWKQQEAVLESSNLTKLLLANSAHEVRTPLNAIVNYLEIALEGALDNETRDHLTKSYSASKSLIYVINDLLDLTNVEKGNELIKDELFDLRTTFGEATSMFDAEARRKGLNYTALPHPGIPDTVVGDQRRVRQAISNLISNAIQHTSSGDVTVEIWRSLDEGEVGKTTIKVAVLDSGPGIPADTLETLFQELEQISGQDDSYFFDESGPGSPRVATDAQEKKALGLGLALVARIVRNMQGQLSVRSELGKGSRFQISLQFSTPEDTNKAGLGISNLPIRTRDSMTAFPSNKNVVLVDNTSSAHKRHIQDSNVGKPDINPTGPEKAETASGLDTLKETYQLSHGSIDETSVAQKEAAHRAFDSCKSESLGGLVGDGARTSSPSCVQPAPLSLVPESIAGPQPFITPPQIPIQELKAPQISAQILNSPPASSLLPGISILPPSNVHVRPLQVLVAEDDPINSKIIQKRLGKVGHTVEVTINGEDCAIAYATDPAHWDVVLMDMQMPLLDGIDATKRIRQFEHDLAGAEGSASCRVPIFAVSASLLERNVQMYMDAGFDGWIMKPIIFARLNTLFAGLYEENIRNSATYEPGQWEIGGWFTPYTKP